MNELLGEPQERSESLVEEKTLLPVKGSKPRIIHPVPPTIPAELPASFPSIISTGDVRNPAVYIFKKSWNFRLILPFLGATRRIFNENVLDSENNL